MGCYVNPKEITKEDWLVENGLKMDAPFDSFEAYKAWCGGLYFPVCLVNNGPFTAAAICYSKREFESFRLPDGRPRIWFIVRKDSLRTVSDLASYEREGLTE